MMAPMPCIIDISAFADDAASFFDTRYFRLAAAIIFADADYW